MTICRQIGLAVGSWTVAGTLAVVNTIDGSNRHLLVPWMLVVLSVAVTSSISLMIWRAQADVSANLRAAQLQGDEPALRIV